MRLSTSTNIYFNRPGGGKADIRDSIRLCAAAGYRVMDMNFHDCVTFKTPFIGDEKTWKNWIEDIQRTAENCGIEFSQSHASFYNFCDTSLSESERAARDKLVYRSVEASALLGIPWAVIHAGTDFDSPRMLEDSRQKNTAYFLPLLEFASKCGTGIAVENLWDLNISPKRRYTVNAEELTDFTDSLKAGNAVGICWDVEHADIMEQNQQKALLLVGNRLKATHISDNAGKDYDHVLPFDGHTDWNSVMDALKGVPDYTGDFTYEIHRHTVRLPDALIPSALRRSVEVGKYLLNI